MIKCKHINNYTSKLKDNRVKYIMATGPYTTTHDAKVPFIMSELSRRNIITHHFHIDNVQGD